MSFFVFALRATQTEFRENLLSIVDAAQYTGVALGDSMRCDLN